MEKPMNCATACSVCLDNASGTKFFFPDLYAVVLFAT